ncbi:hypothetical protein FB451DRAFT_1430517 [Mycena latifolia]|nr:hypothetical protein FB451DRAFT_1430517 [Mycena latifolia]
MCLKSTSQIIDAAVAPTKNPDYPYIVERVAVQYRYRIPYFEFHGLGPPTDLDVGGPGDVYVDLGPGEMALWGHTAHAQGWQQCLDICDAYGKPSDNRWVNRHPFFDYSLRISTAGGIHIAWLKKAMYPGTHGAGVAQHAFGGCEEATCREVSAILVELDNLNDLPQTLAVPSPNFLGSSDILVKRGRSGSPSIHPPPPAADWESLDCTIAPSWSPPLEDKPEQEVLKPLHPCFANPTPVSFVQPEITSRIKTFPALHVPYPPIILIARARERRIPSPVFAAHGPWPPTEELDVGTEGDVYVDVAPDGAHGLYGKKQHPVGNVGQTRAKHCGAPNGQIAAGSLKGAAYGNISWYTGPSTPDGARTVACKRGLVMKSILKTKRQEMRFADSDASNILDYIISGKKPERESEPSFLLPLKPEGSLLSIQTGKKAGREKSGVEGVGKGSLSSAHFRCGFKYCHEPKERRSFRTRDLKRLLFQFTYINPVVRLMHSSERRKIVLPPFACYESSRSIRIWDTNDFRIRVTVARLEIEHDHVIVQPMFWIRSPHFLQVQVGILEQISFVDDLDCQPATVFYMVLKVHTHLNLNDAEIADHGKATPEPAVSIINSFRNDPHQRRFKKLILFSHLILGPLHSESQRRVSGVEFSLVRELRLKTKQWGAKPNHPSPQTRGDGDLLPLVPADGRATNPWTRAIIRTFSVHLLGYLCVGKNDFTYLGILVTAGVEPSGNFEVQPRDSAPWRRGEPSLCAKPITEGAICELKLRGRDCGMRVHIANSARGYMSHFLWFSNCAPEFFFEETERCKTPEMVCCVLPEIVEPFYLMLRRTYICLTDPHTLVNPGAPGGSAPADHVIDLQFDAAGNGINGVVYTPPTLPTLLKVINGATIASDFNVSEHTFILVPNQVVEPRIHGADHGITRPFHLHGHAFDIVQSASGPVNYVNSPRRDAIGVDQGGIVIRFRADNPGSFTGLSTNLNPRAGLAVVFAESPAEQREGPQSEIITPQWLDLCPAYYALPEVELAKFNQAAQPLMGQESPSSSQGDHMGTFQVHHTPLMGPRVAKFQPRRNRQVQAKTDIWECHGLVLGLSGLVLEMIEKFERNGNSSSFCFLPLEEILNKPHSGYACASFDLGSRADALPSEALTHIRRHTKNPISAITVYQSPGYR